MVKLIECPRDAMQGIGEFIPTERKAAYINALLKVGFHTIDFGSFVSPKVIPQMADTSKVLSKMDLSQTSSKLLAIVGNEHGAKDALEFEEIDYLGFPFSISETFQIRNLNSTIKESVDRLDDIQKLCDQKKKQLVVYVSMGFGNPYHEPWNIDIVSQWVKKLAQRGVRILALSDTIGVANPESIRYLYSHLIPEFPDVEFGAHFHTTPDTWLEKIDAAFKSGCNRFDGAIMGLGGCPMAKDDLTGNMATENILQYFENQNVELDIDKGALRNAIRVARSVMPIADDYQGGEYHVH